MRTGKIVTFEGAGKKMKLQEKTLPELQNGEVLIKNLYTTICGSDLHTFCGLRNEKTPTVLGHEIVGRIVSIHQSHPGHDHSGKKLNEGDLVTWTVFCSDPESIWSHRGMPQKAPGLFKYGHAQITGEDAFHGGLAEYCVLKAHTAILKIPETLPLPTAATINCALATVAGAIRLAGNLQGKNVLITGMGLLGMVCVAMCREEGVACVFGADISQNRLQQALSFDVDETILMETKDDTATLQLDDRTVDVVFDMSGAPTAMEAGLEVLHVGGIAVWIGAVFNNRKVQVDAEQVIRRLITIRGLHNYNYDDFKYAVDFIVEHHKKYPFDKVVSKEFSLDETEQAFTYAIKHKPLRVGIKIER